MQSRLPRYVPNRGRPIWPEKPDFAKTDQLGDCFLDDWAVNFANMEVFFAIMADFFATMAVHINWRRIFGNIVYLGFFVI